MNIKDDIVNLFLKTRFNIIKDFFPKSLSNVSNTIKPGMELVFRDSIFTEEKWKVSDLRYHPEYPYQYYVRPHGDRFIVRYLPETFLIKDKITTINHCVSNVNTQHSFRQTYGRFEIRCTVPRERGTWPAFWLWGPQWPKEIDVFEIYGKETGKTSNTQCINIHWGGNEFHKQIRAKKIKFTKHNLTGEISHEFAVEWKKDRIDFFTDGIRVLQFTDKKVIQKYLSSEMWMVVNHAIDPNYVKPDHKYYTSSFRVSYVRAYQFNEYI